MSPRSRDTPLERLQLHNREPHGRRGAQLFRVQLHQDSHDAADVARDAAGITTRLFDVSDLVTLLIESESQKVA
jgi:hypothetical protein